MGLDVLFFPLLSLYVILYSAAFSQIAYNVMVVPVVVSDVTISAVFDSSVSSVHSGSSANDALSIFSSSTDNICAVFPALSTVGLRPSDSISPIFLSCTTEFVFAESKFCIAGFSLFKSLLMESPGL